MNIPRKNRIISLIDMIYLKRGTGVYDIMV